MKKRYAAPGLEIERFEYMDILTASEIGEGTGSKDPWDPDAAKALEQELNP